MRFAFLNRGAFQSLIACKSDRPKYPAKTFIVFHKTEFFVEFYPRLVPADYDGDGKTDPAVFRSGVWYILSSLSGSARYEYWGLSSDILAPADHDADGRADVAVYRNGAWYTSEFRRRTRAKFRSGNRHPDPDGVSAIAYFTTYIPRSGQSKVVRTDGRSGGDLDTPVGH
ncbi:MAG: FG-GAP repeat domain-containing protein [Pyrinomonadaceae bacterium]